MGVVARNERYFLIGINHEMNMMRWYECKTLFAVMLFMICQTISGQSLYDRSSMTIGKISSDGYVYNRSNMTIGRFKNDGYIVDRNNMTLGRIKSDGL